MLIKLYTIHPQSLEGHTPNNTDELKRERVLYALDKTYKKQIERLEQIIINK